MTKHGALHSADVPGGARAGRLTAVVIGNAAALLIILTMAEAILESAGICLNAERTFAKSEKAGLTAIQAVVNLLLFPLVLYVVYFMNFGKTPKQARIAALSFLFILMPCLADLLYAFRPSLPGGYIDFELVISAAMPLFFGGFLLCGTIVRWRTIRAASPEKQYPRCEGCGYNLTGLTEPRCPECGVPFHPRLLADQQQSSVPDEEEKLDRLSSGQRSDGGERRRQRR